MADLSEMVRRGPPQPPMPPLLHVADEEEEEEEEELVEKEEEEETKKRPKEKKYPTGTQAKFGILLLVACDSLPKNVRGNLPKDLSLEHMTSRVLQEQGTCLLCPDNDPKRHSPKSNNFEVLASHPSSMHGDKGGKEISDAVRALRNAQSVAMQPKDGKKQNKMPITDWPDTITVDLDTKKKKSAVEDAYKRFMRKHGEALKDPEQPWNKRSSKKSKKKK